MSWWPGWSSIEGAARYQDFFFWLGIVLLVLVAGSELVSKLYGWRKDALVVAAQINRDSASEKGRSTELVVLQERLDDANKKAMALETRLSWRTITPESRNVLLGTLRSGPKGSVTVMTVMHEEPYQYGRQITDVLRASGFADVQQKMAPTSFSNPGEWILVADRAYAPLHAVAIKEAFDQVGLELFGLSDPRIVPSSDGVVIMIGERKGG